MKDLEFIKNFSKINIKKSCEELGINRGNLLMGRSKEKDVNRLRRYLESKVAKLYEYEEDYDEEKN